MQFKTDNYIVETFGNYEFPNIKLQVIDRFSLHTIIHEIYPLSRKKLKSYMNTLRYNGDTGFINLLKNTYDKLPRDF